MRRRYYVRDVAFFGSPIQDQLRVAVVPSAATTTTTRTA